MNILQDYPELLNVHEAAEILNCRPSTICKLCRTGKLKAMKVGKSWTIPLISIQDFILISTNYKTSYDY